MHLLPVEVVFSSDLPINSIRNLITVGRSVATGEEVTDICCAVQSAASVLGWSGQFFPCDQDHHPTVGSAGDIAVLCDECEQTLTVQAGEGGAAISPDKIFLLIQLALRILDLFRNRTDE